MINIDLSLHFDLLWLPNNEEVLFAVQPKKKLSTYTNIRKNIKVSVKKTILNDPKEQASRNINTLNKVSIESIIKYAKICNP